jgi:hypothetical protein
MKIAAQGEVRIDIFIKRDSWRRKNKIDEYKSGERDSAMVGLQGEK